MDAKTTIGNLFSVRNRHFQVPTYQRAYSWDVSGPKSATLGQVNQFLQDLKDQPEGLPYSLGQFLFEKDATDINKLWVIDGQQRLTTIVIFFAALSKRLKKFKKEKSVYEEVREDFLMRGGRVKFYTVEYDSNFFENEVIHGNKDLVNTRSKKRIRAAFDYFKKELKEAEVSTLLNWKDLVLNAMVTTDLINQKEVAVQRFTLHNDRGKDLTDLEKLKAHLMYQIYLSAKDLDESVDDAITYVQNEFRSIYEDLENIRLLDEDQVLNFHTIAFTSQTDTALPRVYRKLKSSKEPVKWIKDFSSDLKKSFSMVRKVEEAINQNSWAGNVLFLDLFESFPLILKLWHHHHENLDAITPHLRLMEIALFRKAYSTSNFRSIYFQSAATDYEGNLDELRSKLHNWAKNGFKSYWNFEGDFENYLNGTYHYTKLSRYLLWQYENHLREGAGEPQLSYTQFTNKYGKRKLDNSLDHWLPQNPSDKEYTQEFKERYLHNIGNLVLATSSRNSSDKNSTKKTNHGTLLQRQNLPSPTEWSASKIEERQNEIVEFALNHWNPDNVK